MHPYISVKEVSKVYQQGDSEIRALDNVSLDIHEGEFVALMGPSGSGKTTLLNIIAGIDKQTMGTVVVGGQNLGMFTDRQLTAWRTRGIGYIFQFYNLIPVLTAYENAELPLLALDMPKKERHDHVMAALEAVGMTNRMTHLPRQLSGGQEQRVAIARAIVTDSKLLVADEPTGNLDAESEKNIMELISELNKRHKKTVIMVTHDMMAAKYAGKILHLEKGKLKS
jgi:putative ABC transport system ATP-binding protein